MFSPFQKPASTGRSANQTKSRKHRYLSYEALQARELMAGDLHVNAPTPLAADFNSDHRVDLVDFTIVRSNFGKQKSAGDANGDQKVDLADFLILRQTFGQKATVVETVGSNDNGLNPNAIATNLNSEAIDAVIQEAIGLGSDDSTQNESNLADSTFGQSEVDPTAAELEVSEITWALYAVPLEQDTTTSQAPETTETEQTPEVSQVGVLPIAIVSFNDGSAMAVALDAGHLASGVNEDALRDAVSKYAKSAMKEIVQQAIGKGEHDIPGSVGTGGKLQIPGGNSMGDLIDGLLGRGSSGQGSMPGSGGIPGKNGPTGGIDFGSLGGGNSLAGLMGSLFGNGGRGAPGSMPGSPGGTGVPGGLTGGLGGKLTGPNSGGPVSADGIIGQLIPGMGGNGELGRIVGRGMPGYGAAAGLGDSLISFGRGLQDAGVSTTLAGTFGGPITMGAGIVTVWTGLAVEHLGDKVKENETQDVDQDGGSKFRETDKEQEHKEKDDAKQKDHSGGKKNDKKPSGQSGRPTDDGGPGSPVMNEQSVVSHSDVFMPSDEGGPGLPFLNEGSVMNYSDVFRPTDEGGPGSPVMNQESVLNLGDLYMPTPDDNGGGPNMNSAIIIVGGNVANLSQQRFVY